MMRVIMILIDANDLNNDDDDDHNDDDDEHDNGNGSGHQIKKNKHPVTINIP